MASAPKLALSLDGHVLTVSLNRPRRKNALDLDLFRAIHATFTKLDTALTDAMAVNDEEESAQDAKTKKAPVAQRTPLPLDAFALADLTDVRCVVLRGSGDCFCSGIDLGSFAQVGAISAQSDSARTAVRVQRTVKFLQAPLTAIERCVVPVIVAVHGFCIGGGIDMISACDIRMCSADAQFSVKEVDIGIAADIGTLQRLPRIVGNQALVREWCFTARRFGADEASKAGLVARVVPTHDELFQQAHEMAVLIAKKSPIAVVGTKQSLLANNRYEIDQGLDRIAQANAAMLQSEDVEKCMEAGKDTPLFSKL